MRAQLVSLSPVAKGLVHMILFAFLAAVYLLALFGLGEAQLPALLRPETDYFLFEEMPLSVALTFSGVVVAAAAAAGFCYGALSALLYNGAARLVGGEVGRIRPLEATSRRAAAREDENDKATPSEPTPERPALRVTDRRAG